MQQLIDSKAWINFSQGIDIRLMTEEKAEMLRQIKVKSVHLAWDRYEDKNDILPKLEMFKRVTGWNYRKLMVYVLVNFNTTIEQDLERIYTLRDMGYDPYVMIYNKPNAPAEVKRLQRWVNNKIIFRSTQKFEEFKG